MEARKKARLPGPFPMRHGGMLPELEIAYETWGVLAPARDNALLIVTGLSPGAPRALVGDDPTPSWWGRVKCGAGGAIRLQPLSSSTLNSLGSCHGSTGPASSIPFPLCLLSTPIPSHPRHPDIATAARETVRA
jgi:homoserine O-acetyltransferase